MYQLQIIWYFLSFLKQVTSLFVLTLFFLLQGLMLPRLALNSLCKLRIFMLSSLNCCGITGVSSHAQPLCTVFAHQWKTFRIFISSLSVLYFFFSCLQHWINVQFHVLLDQGKNERKWPLKRASHRYALLMMKDMCIVHRQAQTKYGHYLETT